jgi:protein ImuA
MEPARTRAADAFGVSAAGQEQRQEALMAGLRRSIARLEQSLPQIIGHPPKALPWNFALPAIDAHLPASGLARTGLHDVAPDSYGDMPAVAGFATALAIRRLQDAGERRLLLWCRLAREEREYGRLYGHGLETLGLSRRRFLTVTLKKPLAVLWTAEEALKSGALALVIADADPRHIDLTMTRRLALAAEAGKAAGLLLLSQRFAGSTASHSRWTVAATRSQPPPYEPQAPGAPAFTLELLRARGGRPGAWTVEWQNASHRFALVSGIRDRALHPWTDESEALAAAPGHAILAG